MSRFVAFLRGINVSGHIVKKETLQQAFLSLGFENVSTFKQSGNVIFETDQTPEKLPCTIAEKLKATLGYDVQTFIRSVPQLQIIIQQSPFQEPAAEGTSFLVTFLSSVPSPFPLQLPLTISKSTAKIVAARGSEVFSETHGSGEGALPNPFIEKTLKTKATTRNLNIITEIATKYS